MHKNSYGPKTLVGNWQEERSSDSYKKYHDLSAPHLAAPNFSKFVPISKDIGNKRDYEKEAHDDACENWLQF